MTELAYWMLACVSSRFLDSLSVTFDSEGQFAFEFCRFSEKVGEALQPGARLKFTCGGGVMITIAHGTFTEEDADRLIEAIEVAANEANLEKYGCIIVDVSRRSPLKKYISDH